MDIETRKQLFNAYANCRSIRVAKYGEILLEYPVSVETVSVNKDGDVFVEWRNSIYDNKRIAEVDMVDNAWENYIDGVFSSRDVAKAVAAEWFDRQKKEKIAELEAELKKLKES